MLKWTKKQVMKEFRSTFTSCAPEFMTVFGQERSKRRVFVLEDIDCGVRVAYHSCSITAPTAGLVKTPAQWPRLR